jgi:hypothetical protein
LNVIECGCTTVTLQQPADTALGGFQCLLSSGGFTIPGACSDSWYSLLDNNLG